MSAEALPACVENDGWIDDEDDEESLLYGLDFCHFINPCLMIPSRWLNSFCHTKFLSANMLVPLCEHLRIHKTVI